MKEPVSSSLTLDDFVSLYTEIKSRLDHLATEIAAIRNLDWSWSTAFKTEYCYLQIRLICELIALASIAAHTNQTLNSDLMTAYNADKIFELLSRANPFCFPRPASIRLTDNGVEVNVSDQGALDRKGLAKIYRHCDSYLHRGRAKGLVAREVRQLDLTWLARAGRQLGQLVSHHVVMIPDQKRTLIVQMVGPDGNVTVAIVEPVGHADSGRMDPNFNSER